MRFLGSTVLLFAAAMCEKQLLPPNTKLNAHSLWDALCSSYSRGALTNESDKLVAMSAIARRKLL